MLGRIKNDAPSTLVPAKLRYVRATRAPTSFGIEPESYGCVQKEGVSVSERWIITRLDQP